MNLSNLAIHEETAEDRAAVHTINRLAFDRAEEAELVDAVRRMSQSLLSLVARLGEEPVGHILFTPVEIHSESGSARAMGLGPVAVLPEFQRLGIGSRLIEIGLRKCRQAGHRVVFVLGHPDYYPRFGFRPAAEGGFFFKNHEFDPYFFVLELEPGATGELSGEVRYLPAFDET
jgi:putative acetyltransferase